MSEQVNNSLTFLAFFTESKLGKAGLTVTWDIIKNGSSLSTGNAATAIGGGLYSYTLSSGSVDAEGLYVGIAKTSTSTVDQQHIPSLWTVGKGGIEYLDASVGTRATPAQVTTIVSAVAGGGGSVEHVLTVKDDSGDPIDGVAVTVRTTTDSAETPVATGTTNAFGNVTFSLDPGTYYAWCQQGRTNFTNPTAFEVTT